MRKLVIMAVAAVVVAGWGGCSKEKSHRVDVTHADVAVRITGGMDVSRAVEDPGSTATGTIKLLDGHIFVLSSSNDVVHSEPLDKTAARTATGQRLSTKVPVNAKVYVVANNVDPEFTAPATSPTAWTDITDWHSDISTQPNYDEAMLSNEGRLPVRIEEGATPTDYVVGVALAPLISRLELVQLTGIDSATGDVLEYEVTGVFVDDYFPEFNYVGGGVGTIFSQGDDTTFTGIGDTGSWTADASGVAVAGPAGEVWAYDLAAGSVPRLIVRVVESGGETKFITVTGYTGVTAFKPGYIYRINNIEFTGENLTEEPNQEDVSLSVKVSITEWKLEEPDAILQ